jgi:hypothetical protein
VAVFNVGGWVALVSSSKDCSIMSENGGRKEREEYGRVSTYLYGWTTRLTLVRISQGSEKTLQLRQLNELLNTRLGRRHPLPGHDGSESSIRLPPCGE